MSVAIGEHEPSGECRQLVVWTPLRGQGSSDGPADTANELCVFGGTETEMTVAEKTVTITDVTDGAADEVSRDGSERLSGKADDDDDGNSCLTDCFFFAVESCGCSIL